MKRAPLRVNNVLRPFMKERTIIGLDRISVIFTATAVTIVGVLFWSGAGVVIPTAALIVIAFVTAVLLSSSYTMCNGAFGGLGPDSQMLRAALESTAEGILVVDVKGRIIMFNKQFQLMWHIPQAVVDTRDDSKAVAFVLDQLKDPDAFVKKVRELYQSSEASLDVLNFKDGKIFERYSRPQLVGERIIGRVWSFRDTTARVHTQRALQEKNEELERFNKLLVGRELKMIELKEQIEALRKKT